MDSRTKNLFFLLLFFFTITSCTKKNEVPRPASSNTPNVPVETSTPPPPIHPPQNTNPVRVATALKFNQQPSDVETVDAIQVVISAVDSEGNVVESHKPIIYISALLSPSNTPVAFATGPNFKLPVNGVANFDTPKLDQPGTYTLKAYSQGLEISSQSFNVTPPKERMITMIFNGKKQTVRFIPPDTIIDTDGGKIPFRPDQNGVAYLEMAPHLYKMWFQSPKVLIVNRIR